MSGAVPDEDAIREARRNVNIVFCDATGLIRGYASTTVQNIDLHPVGPGETVVIVEREPNLAVDKYCDPATGEMYPRAYPFADLAGATAPAFIGEAIIS